MGIIYNDKNVDVTYKTMILRNIGSVSIPEILIEGDNIAINLMLKITKEELDDLIIDNEISVMNYIIDEELYLKTNKDYELLDKKLINNILITKIDEDYFNISIDIPSKNIIINENIILEVEDEINLEDNFEEDN